MASPSGSAAWTASVSGVPSATVAAGAVTTGARSTLVTVTAVLDVSASDAHALYDELATHSLVSRHPRGVVLHDKIRELLQARLRFTSETRYAQLVATLTAHLGSRGGVADA